MAIAAAIPAIAAAAGGTATAATAISAAAAIAGGLAAKSKAKGEQKRAEANAFIGRTRAIQTDTNARNGLEDELGSLRNVLGANGQRPNVGTAEVVNQLRETRDRDRRIQFGNRTQEAADARLAGQNAGRRGSAALVGGAIKAGPSLFDLLELNR